MFCNSTSPVDHTSIARGAAEKSGSGVSTGASLTSNRRTAWAVSAPTGSRASSPGSATPRRRPNRRKWTSGGSGRCPNCLPETMVSPPADCQRAACPGSPRSRTPIPPSAGRRCSGVAVSSNVGSPSTERSAKPFQWKTCRQREAKQTPRRCSQASPARRWAPRPCPPAAAAARASAAGASMAWPWKAMEGGKSHGVASNAGSSGSAAVGESSGRS